MKNLKKLLTLALGAMLLLACEESNDDIEVGPETPVTKEDRYPDSLELDQ